MNRRKIALIGGGGHALSVAAALGRDIEGYVDVAHSAALPWPYLGTDAEYLSAPQSAEPVITLVSGAKCDLSARRRLIEKYDSQVTEHHAAADAYIESSATIGAGSVIMRRAVVNCHTHIGRHCIVNTGAIVEHECHIGCNVFIGPGAVICGGVTVGDDVYIGANAAVRPGVSIASGCVIGLGAAVVSDINEAGTYVGNPAKLKNI